MRGGMLTALAGAMILPCAALHAPSRLVYRARAVGRRHPLTPLSVAEEPLLDAAQRLAVAELSERPIIKQYSTSGTWLWRQWSGTVLETSWFPTVMNMVSGAMVTFFIRATTPSPWPLFTVPDAAHPVVSRLNTLNVMWQYQASLTTFILTFFLAQAFAHWKACMLLGRRIQGRIHDVNLMLVTHSARDKDGRYTPAARRLIETVGRHARLFHTLYWARPKFEAPTGSFSSVNTEEGLERLQTLGVLTEDEKRVLLDTGGVGRLVGSVPARGRGGSRPAARHSTPTASHVRA